MSSVYHSLPLQGKQIRLLQIEATCPQITCSLHVASFDDSMAFDALSYLWGDPSLVTPAIVNGDKVHITNNLAEALRYIIPHWQREHPDRSLSAFRLWVDALCIDQSSTVEKNHQVPLMHDIYTRAERVYCWLDPPSQYMYLAFEAMNTIRAKVYLEQIGLFGHPTLGLSWSQVLIDGLSNSGQKLSNLNLDLSWIENNPIFHESGTDGDPEANGSVSAWACLYRMATLPYWRRVWVFQELILAKNPVFICGTAHTSFEAILSTRTFLESIPHGRFTPRDSRLRFFSRKTWHNIFFRTTRTDWRTIDAILNTRERFQAQSLSPSGSLRWAISVYSRLLEATDPRDHYYGLDGICNLALEPDYAESKTVAQVACEYFKRYLQMCQQLPDQLVFTVGGPLYLLQWSGIGNGWATFSGMPSWTPNYPGIAQSRDKTGKGIIAWNSFGDSGLSVGVFDKPREIKVIGTSLYVPAMRLDSIQIPTQTPDHTCGLCLKFRAAEPSNNEFDRAKCQLISAIHSRPDGYVDGTHMVLVIDRLMMKDNKGTLSQSGNFLLILFTVYKKVRLKRLDTTHGLEFLYEFLFLLHLGDLAKTLAFALQALSRELDFYATMPKELANDPNWPILAVEILQWPGNLTSFSEICDSMPRFMEPHRRLAETRSGYMGYFPEDTREGDEVFLLQESHLPSVLRKEGDHYLHVGVCFVGGMTVERVEELANYGKLNVEMVEIR